LSAPDDNFAAFGSTSPLSLALPRLVLARNAALFCLAPFCLAVIVTFDFALFRLLLALFRLLLTLFRLLLTLFRLLLTLFRLLLTPGLTLVRLAQLALVKPLSNDNAPRLGIMWMHDPIPQGVHNAETIQQSSAFVRPDDEALLDRRVRG
jgi:hypothetical protein